jgi:hypothetical protein
MRKSVVTISLVGLALFSGPLFAQHGGHGGAPGGGHMSGGSAGHFSAGAHTVSRPSSAPVGRAYAAPARSYNGLQSSPYRNRMGAYGTRRPIGSRRVGYGYGGLAGYPYGYLGYYPYGGLDLFGDDADDPNLQNSYVSSGYDGDPGGQQQADTGPDDGTYIDPPQNGPRPPYNPAGANSDGLPQAKVALIFKDGRRLDIQNYVATRTRILVRDTGANRDIPVSTLDIPATQAANEAAGVDFSLPGSPL